MLERSLSKVLWRLGLAFTGWVALLAAGGCPGGEGGSPGSATAGEETATGSLTDTSGDGGPGEPGPSTGSTGDEPASTEAPSSTGDGGSTGEDVAVCGDGVLDPGEACDLGPMNADDAACTSVCAAAICGDGLVEAGVEECDEGLSNTDKGACTLACKHNVCGDEKLWEGVEECDTPNKGDGYGQCTGSCVWGPHCGDGIPQLDHEECDDGETPDPSKCSGECTILKRVIFVSSELYAGDLGGLDGANTKCQLLAAAAKLPRPETYRAWLSAGGSSPSSWVEELDPAKRYQLPSGTTVADNWAELTSGALKVEIGQTEKQQTLEDGSVVAVWSGTKSDGSPAQATCGGWMSASSGTLGRIGHAVFTNSKWTDSGDLKCNQEARLYCLEVWPGK